MATELEEGTMGGETEGEDRISQLPDELLHEILKHLDPSDVVEISILSKRWVHIWTTLPSLNFEPMHRDIVHYYVRNFLENRNHQFAISTFKADSLHLNRKTIKYLLDHNVEHLRICNGWVKTSPRLKSTSLKTLYLECCTQLFPMHCTQLFPMHWTLPSLTSLYLEYAGFGTEISGFENLTDLTLKVGSYSNVADGVKRVFTINCPSLKILTLGSVTHGDKLVVSAPYLSCLKIHSYNMPELNAGDGFPFIKEVDIHIRRNYYPQEEDYILNLMKQNLITIFKAVRRTLLLKLSDVTLRVLRKIPDFPGDGPCPFDNLKLLSLQWIHEKPTRSTDPVINYLLSNCPSAEMIKAK